MEEKTSAYIWPEELTLQMLELRLSNDKLFKLKKQPWGEFYKILVKNGFPKYVSRKQVSKKFGYLFSMYRIAKKENDKSWKYFDMFNKIFKKSKELGKYESWSNEWRSKLIACVTTAKEQNLNHKTLWRTVEKAMRSQNLPEDCCVNDMQGLWHYLKMIFVRTYRLFLKKSKENSKWPLYDAMLSYYKTYENLEALDNEPYIPFQKRIKTEVKNESRESDVDKNDNKQDFNWSKDLTESLIHIRFGNDSLFKERPQAWKDFVAILKDEYGFPEKLKFREVAKKWQSLYSEYQKAKSAKNPAWCYYNLFEAYLGEGTSSINPLFYWQEKWAIKLIEVRTSLEDLFVESQKNNLSSCWREVDKRLRRDGIPLDHSLLDLDYIWNYLIRTFKTKKTHATKGLLKEQWPYFTYMAKYMEVHESRKNQTNDFADDNDAMINDDTMHDVDEDDIKLFDLKQKMEGKEMKDKGLQLEGKQCRACANVAECVDIFEDNDDNDGDDIATKLSLIAGVQVEKSDKLPPQICYNCLQELETAYKFRRKCQDVDEQFRESSKNIKIEILEKIDDLDLHDDMINEDFHEENDFEKPNEYVEKVQKTQVIKEKRKYKRYSYYKVCEICGLHTENLKSHIDKHNEEKPYSCDLCGKKFKFKNARNVHKSTVHAPAPKKTCDICGKTFMNIAYYKKHYAYHANERKYSCETCGRRFNSADVLKVHNFIHTGERSYVCSECGKTFRTSGCVNRHKRIVHKIMRKIE